MLRGRETGFYFLVGAIPSPSARKAAEMLGMRGRQAKRQLSLVSPSVGFRRLVARGARIAHRFIRQQGTRAEPAPVHTHRLRKGHMMRQVFVLAALGAALAASPAAAQSRSGGGFYVGAIAGYQGLKVESSSGAASAKADNAVFGVQAGYDLSLGSAFVGAEGEVSTSSGDTRFPGSTGAAYDSLKANGQYYVGARAGINLTPGVAAFGKVGYTSMSTKAFSSAGTLTELKDNTDGIRYGAGLQLALPGPLEARVEYRRSRYKDAVSGTYGDATTDQVVAGVGVRF
jgi:outer membrane immunogenic protein